MSKNTLLNVLSISHDEGESIQVAFNEVAENGKLASGWFEAFSEQNPDTANIVISLPDGAWEGHDGIEFALNRAPKTLGTYATRVNKVVAGVDPAYRDTRVGGGGRKANVGIEQHGKASVRLFVIDSEGEAVVSKDEVTTNAFSELAPYIQALLDESKRGRLNRVREYADGVEVAPPAWSLNINGESVQFKSEPTEQQLTKARADLAVAMIKKGVAFDSSDILTAEPSLTGGGEKWLEAFLAENF